MPKQKRNAKVPTMAWCPVHEYDRWQCDDDCARQRIEAGRAANALRRYFWARRHGQRPLAEVQAAYAQVHEP